MEEVAMKTTVLGGLAALINYSDPQMFGAAVTGSLVYYVMFADRGKWVNIVLFLTSIPLALHLGTPVSHAMGFASQSSGVTLLCGAVGLLGLERIAQYIRKPSAFFTAVREFRSAWRKEDGS